MKPKRECTDETVIARIREFPTRQFQPGSLATYFDVKHADMHSRLKRLAAEGKIKTAYATGHTVFYFPTERAEEKPQRVVNTLQISREMIAALERCKELHEYPSGRP